MTITRSECTHGVDLTLEGRLDTNTAPKLQEELLPELNAGKHVLLDFAKVSYVSSAGLRVLLMGEKAAKAKSSRQVLKNVSATIMEVFEITGFASILNIEQN